MTNGIWYDFDTFFLYFSKIDKNNLGSWEPIIKPAGYKEVMDFYYHCNQLGFITEARGYAAGNCFDDALGNTPNIIFKNRYLMSMSGIESNEYTRGGARAWYYIYKFSFFNETNNQYWSRVDSKKYEY